MGEAIGDPVILFYASDAPWRSGFVKKNVTDNNGFVTDGPYLHRMADDSLIMLWTNFNNDGYVIGYAKSLSGEVLGPWQQMQEPLYGHDGGHGMLFHTFDGQLMMCMHGPNEHLKKRILLFQMLEDKGKLRIINEVTGNWYDGAKGPADRFVYKEPCAEEPCFTRVANHGYSDSTEVIEIAEKESRKETKEQAKEQTIEEENKEAN